MIMYLELLYMDLMLIISDYLLKNNWPNQESLEGAATLRWHILVQEEDLAVYYLCRSSTDMRSREICHMP